MFLGDNKNKKLKRQEKKKKKIIISFQVIASLPG